MSREIENISTRLEGIVADLAPSVVWRLSPRLQASGFVWRPGLLDTWDESVAEDDEVGVVLLGGERARSQIVGRDPSTAIALLKVERSGLRPVALAAVVPSVGALAVAIGAEAGAATAAIGVTSVSRGSWQSMR